MPESEEDDCQAEDCRGQTGGAQQQEHRRQADCRRPECGFGRDWPGSGGETVRARRSGRYRAAYRFTNATRGRTLTFRARVRRDDSFPYYLGYSNRVRVRIR